MSPGDIVMVRANVWRVEGVYLGAVGQESLVELRCLTMRPGTCRGSSPTTSTVPLDMIPAGSIYTPVQR